MLCCTSTLEGSVEAQSRKVGRCLSTEKERKGKAGKNPNCDDLGRDDEPVIVLAQMGRKRSFQTGQAKQTKQARNILILHGLSRSPQTHAVGV